MVASIVATPGPSGSEHVSDDSGQILGDVIKTIGGDPPSSIPLVVKLLENPVSPIALPGNIDLYRHDCLHLLLNRGFSLDDEAFVIGFTMGNDEQTTRLHLEIFKLCSWLLYPKPYRFSRAHLKVFDLGVGYGQSVRSKNLNRFDFKVNEHKPLNQLRQLLGINRALLTASDLAKTCDR